MKDVGLIFLPFTKMPGNGIKPQFVPPPAEAEGTPGFSQGMNFHERIGSPRYVVAPMVRGIGSPSLTVTLAHTAC